MKLKIKHIISLGILGFIIMLFGYLKKIMHHPSADTLLNISYYTVTASAVLLLIKLLLNRDKNHFLNK